MTDLSALFALDPRKHTTESLDELIAILREKRSQFALENNIKVGKVRATKPKKETKLGAAGIGLDLDL